ncbi:hypothetical protein EJM73_06465 [Clostridium botulinum]|uniref:Uncharacterized protein n=2 Tax=Clostridium botulinum TaxID=1491 RepID=A0A077K295_CLOBO|nr:hypothetical protein [Clostridium botulinum]KEI84168.1 hypothetical protein N493_20020 [Clostridium botulinum B2 433]KIS21557.1 hypothetical protein N495_19295 [Clostridium botulinum B2 450]NCI20600.1 hypothetical protein [Clostridium botulinum]NCI35309.1 hypothetical protein [Clostridium botulinum]NCI72099.1 hypothetical protein [Clostridium botulinum]
MKRRQDTSKLFVDMYGEPIKYGKIPLFKRVLFNIKFKFRNKPIRVKDGNTTKFIISKDISRKK